ncbi:hypothetical protein ACJMK2_012193 [Sinanodonta woodiana]|uniref:Uncharacterized protein n=1 Tax=Sinanodonta woodiana TaxID=1069815 RepID=A0ABD3V9H8_SINWO
MTSSQENPHSDFFTCKICKDEFSDPRSLPCLHSFCKKCITDFIIKSTKGQRAPQGFNCPICKRFVDAPDAHQPPNIWADLLPQSHLITSLINGIKLRNDVSRCDPCYRRKEKVIASKWCKDCAEALCEPCVSFHKSLKYSQNHTLLDFDEIKHQPIRSTLLRPPCLEHENTTLGFYCEDHGKVVCSSCVTIDHRKCSHVVSTLEAASKQRSEADSLMEKLRNQNGWSSRILENRQHSLKSLEDAESQLTHQITSIRQQLDDILATQEKKIMEDLKALKENEKNSYEREMSKCEEIICTTGNAMNILKTSLQHGTDSDLLLSVENVKKESNLCEKELSHLSNQLQDILLIFTPDKSISTILGSLKEIGKISYSHSHVQVAAPYNVPQEVDERDESTSPTVRPVSPPESPIFKLGIPKMIGLNSETARLSRLSRNSKVSKTDYIRSSRSKVDDTSRSQRSRSDVLHQTIENETARTQMDIHDSFSPIPMSSRKIAPNLAQMDVFFKARTLSDRENCILTGATMLMDGRIVLVDQMMRKLKLFDAEYRWIGEKVLPARPYDVTYVNEREVAVTFPREKKIQVYAVRQNDFLPIFTINVAAKCWGLSYSSTVKRFAVCCYTQPPCIKIISRSEGREMKALSRDKNGVELFYFPDYVAFDNAGRNLYVTDKYRKSVISLTSEGDKRWELNYSMLKNPRGIAVHGNRVFVAGSRSHNILLMTTEGEIIGDIILEGITFPNKICLTSTADRLLVTQYQGTLIDTERNSVKVFRLD